MKHSFFITFFCCFFVFDFYAQSLSIGTGFFLENYRPKGKNSQYHDESTSYYWFFLGGCASYDFSLKNKWVRKMSVYTNAYPLMYGFDLRKFPENNAILISNDLISPEIGFLSHYQLLKKPKHKVDLGTGLSLRFVISPVTGAQSSYNSFSLSYESAYYQKSQFALVVPIDIRYTYNFKPQLGFFFNVKRSYGFFNWVEQRISYNYTNPITGIKELGNATMVSNGGRLLIEFGLVFNLAKID